MADRNSSEPLTTLEHIPPFPSIYAYFFDYFINEAIIALDHDKVNSARFYFSLARKYDNARFIELRIEGIMRGIEAGQLGRALERSLAIRPKLAKTAIERVKKQITTKEIFVTSEVGEEPLAPVRKERAFPPLKETMTISDRRTEDFVFEKRLSPDKDKKIKHMDMVHRETVPLKAEVDVPKRDEMKRKISPPRQRPMTKRFPPLLGDRVKPGRKVTTGEFGVPPAEKTAPMPKRISKAEEEQKIVIEEGGPLPLVIDMDDELWARQPNTDMEIVTRTAVILRGDHIERYLIVTPNIVTVERLDRDQIKITAIKRGSTFLHVWDARGRWTFNIRGIPPLFDKATAEKKQRMVEEHVDPFRFSYSNNWGSSYSAGKFSDLSRQSLNFQQWMGVHGPTPYGQFDASVNFFKFEESTELVGQTVGLTNGNIGPLKDFRARGWDASSYFSTLSLPGRSFRGGLIDAFAFDRKIKYTYLKGQDRATFTEVSPDFTEVRKSYIEGARVQLFPDSINSFAINYASGHGEVRPEDLKDKVFSFEASRRIKDVKVVSELAYDEDVYAGFIQTSYQNGDHALGVNFHDIDEGFRTITGRPADSGEIGGEINWAWSPGKYRVGADLELFRDRGLANEENPDDLNYFGDVSLSFPINDTSRWSTVVTYLYTPQLISERENIRINNLYTKQFRFFNNRNFLFTFGNSYQRNRFPTSPSSESDRYGLRAGLRFSPFKDFSYFVDYDYTWVEEKFTGETSRPSALTTGANYSRRLTDTLYSNFSVDYRNESNTESSLSFLAGEDSVSASAGLTFNPAPDYSIFMDSRLRYVFPENPREEEFVDADLRFGVRMGWDTFFRWDPRGIVKGYVFKDQNGNNTKDAGETGVPDIIVKVGKNEYTTDADGAYRADVRAKKVRVRLDAESLPSGYLVSSSLEEDVVIKNRQTHVVDFAVTTRTGIYGVVYLDKNLNGRVDPDDTLVPKVRMILDGTKTAETDGAGGYEFDGLTPGTHTIKVDVNSIPMRYLPSIKVTDEIEVIEGANVAYHVPLRMSGAGGIDK